MRKSERERQRQRDRERQGERRRNFNRFVVDALGLKHFDLLGDDDDDDDHGPSIPNKL